VRYAVLDTGRELTAIPASRVSIAVGRNVRPTGVRWRRRTATATGSSGVSPMTNARRRDSGGAGERRGAALPPAPRRRGRGHRLRPPCGGRHLPAPEAGRSWRRRFCGGPDQQQNSAPR